MRIAQIKNLDIANGPGCRVSVFVSGCTRGCPGCFNKVAWDFEYGEPFDDRMLERIINLVLNPRISGLSILGGEPFEPKNRREVLRLIQSVRNCTSEKDIWCFTGYTLEELMDSYSTMPYTLDILRAIDVLVDGPFLIDQKNLALQFRGSANQRIIDIKKSINRNKIVLWKDKYDIY